MFLSLPSTRLGWWSVGLSAAIVVLFVINTAVFLPAPGVVPWREALIGIVLLLCGLGGGIIALIALIWDHERSALVWLAMVPRLFVLFMIGEFLLALFDQHQAFEPRSLGLASQITLTEGGLSAAFRLLSTGFAATPFVSRALHSRGFDLRGCLRRVGAHDQGLLRRSQDSDKWT